HKTPTIGTAFAPKSANIDAHCPFKPIETAYRPEGSEDS
ncbi:MAG: hypothetical protein UX60_C0006G0001, partial [Berkelbacteria bacterium GW2011_GWA2_46_7]